MITAYNPTIEQYRGELPTAYVVAIIQHESDFKEKHIQGKNGAIGLMQVVNSLLDEYNSRKNTKLTRADMLAAEKNIMVGCWGLMFWLKYLRAMGFEPDFSNATYVQILTMAWNSGGSHVKKAIKSLQAKGMDITPYNIREEAKIILPGSPLATRELGWSRNVVSSFFDFKGYQASRGLKDKENLYRG